MLSILLSILFTVLVLIVSVGVAREYIIMRQAEYYSSLNMDLVTMRNKSLMTTRDIWFIVMGYNLLQKHITAPGIKVFKHIPYKKFYMYEKGIIATCVILPLLILFVSYSVFYSEYTATSFFVIMVVSVLYAFLKEINIENKKIELDQDLYKMVKQDIIYLATSPNSPYYKDKDLDFLFQ